MDDVESRIEDQSSLGEAPVESNAVLGLLAAGRLDEISTTGGEPAEGVEHLSPKRHVASDEVADVLGPIGQAEV